MSQQVLPVSQKVPASPIRPPHSPRRPAIVPLTQQQKIVVQFASPSPVPSPQPIVKSINKAVLPSPSQSPLAPTHSQPPVSFRSLEIVLVPQKPVLRLLSRRQIVSQ
ncbi:hypothetical protein APHAL10511_005281 [Amanita phalloides]|nr:hypothetical protein APHAL10511_005281 [Amanita phalloides]